MVALLLFDRLAVLFEVERVDAGPHLPHGGRSRWAPFATKRLGLGPLESSEARGVGGALADELRDGDRVGFVARERG